MVTHDGQVVHPALAAPTAARLIREVLPVSTALLTDLTIFVLSLWVGFEVISKVPATLHTPLMSAANSIHGIVLVGAMLIAVTAHNAGRLHDRVRRGGVRRHERGRRLRGHRPDAQDVPGARPAAPGRAAAPADGGAAGSGSRRSMSGVQHGHPAHLPGRRVVLRARPAPDEQPGHRAARQPGLRGRHGRRDRGHAGLIIHAGAITATGWIVMLAGALVGGGVGLYSARTVQMTAMPQLVSMFNAVGGGAAALVAIHDYIAAGRRGRRRAESTTVTTAARRDHRRGDVLRVDHRGRQAAGRDHLGRRSRSPAPALVNLLLAAVGAGRRRVPDRHAEHAPAAGSW